MSSPQTTILTASAASALLYAFKLLSPPSLSRLLAKTTSTALLSTLVTVRSQPRLLTGALGLGSLGDAFLAYDNTDTAFLGGLSSFLVAHLMYIRLFLRMGGGVDKILSEKWRVGLAGAILVAAPSMNALMIPRVKKELRVPIMVYSSVIMCMFLSALGIDNSKVVAGAVMFTASDIVLATERFLLPAGSALSPWLQHATWALYYSGQLLIAQGVPV